MDAIAGITTRYYYDDQRVAVQTAVVGAAETDERYFVFGNYIDEVLVMRNLTGSPADTYYAHDHLYSAVALFAANGTVAERYEYDAYGQVQILNSNFSPLTSSLYGNPYAFTGRELDTLDAGRRTLMYYRARTYDPETGRFMQRDPLGINPAGGDINSFEIHRQYTDGVNIYEYAKSGPLIYLDPDGNEVILTTLFVGNAIRNGILACYAGYWCVKCVNDTAEIIQYARERMDGNTFIDWFKNTEPYKGCGEICAIAGYRGLKTLVWYGGKYYVFRYNFIKIR